MKADPFAQQKLAELQEIDSNLDRLAYQRTHLSVVGDIAEAERERDSLADDVIRATTSLQDVQRELRKSETDVDAVRQRAARDHDLLSSGTLSARQLTEMEHEIASLARRQEVLEDEQLALMETAESIEERVAAIEIRQTEVDERLVDLQAQLAEQSAELEADMERYRQQRAAVEPEVSEELLTLYTRLRQDNPRAVGTLISGRCSACQMELARADLSDMREADPASVLRCPECSAILVRP